MTLRGAHILSTDDLSRERIEYLIQWAEYMLPYSRGTRITRVLEGAILANLFFEPSTRSRISFGAAFNRLGGAVRDTVGIGMSSIAKGESLRDTARVISGYADVIVMRHPEVGSVKAFAETSRVPVLNSGDGAGEHPTQALLDAFTIVQELGAVTRLDGLRLTVVGDLKYGRAVHSLVKLLARFERIHVVCVADPELQLPSALCTALRQAGHQVDQTSDIHAGLGHGDVVYATRVQEERFASQADAQRHRGRFSIDRALYESVARPGAVLMHPLPRDAREGAQELSTDLDGLPQLAIFRQTDNGIAMRMALFAAVLGVEDQVEETARESSWLRRREF
jgi:aspartate carbamoyltransferase catalytic subunit